MKTRKIVLKRMPEQQHQFALYDVESGEIFASQAMTTIISQPDETVKVIVEFIAPVGDDSFTIEA